MSVTKSYELVADAIKSNGDALFQCYVKVPKHVVKKNRRPIMSNRRTGRRFLGKSIELVGAERLLINAFRTQMIRNPEFKMITEPIWCVFLFYFPAEDFVVKNGKRKGKLSGRLPDLSNLLELPQDALQSAGVIENDGLICSLDLSRRVPGSCHALECFVFRHPLDLNQRPRMSLVET